MDYKLNLITPSLYSNVGPTNCCDELVEKFAHHLKNRSDFDFNLKCKYDPIPGMAFIHRFEDFEERFLVHSEYAVIIASPSSQLALNRFMPRLLVFLTAKPIWQNRFLFVILGKVNVLSNLVVNDPIEFSMNNWEDHDEESWIKLFDLIKIKWEPHVEKNDSENTFENTLDDSINGQSNSTKENQNLLKNEIDGDNHNNNIENTTLKTDKIDEKSVARNTTFNSGFHTNKFDESTNNASDLLVNTVAAGNHRFGKDFDNDNLRKDNTLDKTHSTINISGICEENLIDVSNKVNTSHEKNVKGTNLNVDHKEISNLSNDTQGDFKNNTDNIDNNSPIHSEIKTNDNSQMEEGFVEKEETLRMIKLASRKLQGSSVTLENMLYFQSDVPINNEPKVFENREMNTDESIFKNKNNASNEKELPPIIEHSKENINASPLISNQSSCTDSEQTFECDLNDQIIVEQDEEYITQSELIKTTPGEFDFQSFDSKEETEILKENNNKISLKTMKLDLSNLNQISKENHESKQIKPDEKYLISDNKQDYDNKLIEMKNDLNFTVSNQLDKTNVAIKTKDENSVRINTDVNIMCSGNEFDKTNEVSINKSVPYKDDVEFNMSSRKNNQTLLEVENYNKLDTSIDDEIITHVTLDLNDTRDFSNDINNFGGDVSDNLHLYSVKNSKTDESGNFNNNDNNKNIINSEIESDVKPILNIKESVDKHSLDPNFDDNSNLTVNNQGFKSIDNIGGEIQSLVESSRTNVNKKFIESNEHAEKDSFEINNASIDKTISEKFESLSSDSSLSLTQNKNFHAKLINIETISSILEIEGEPHDQDNKPEISIDRKINTQIDSDSNIDGDSSVGINKEVSDKIHLFSDGNLVSGESSNINNNNNITIDSKVNTDIKLISNIGVNNSENEMPISLQNIINPNLDEGRNLIGDNIVDVIEKITISEESDLPNINKERTETNEDNDKTGLEKNSGIFSENIDSLGGNISQLFSMEFRNNDIENCDLDNGKVLIKIDNEISVDKKCNEVIIDNKNKIESEETEFISQIITDVDNGNLEEKRQKSENNDYKKESFISEMANRQNDDERKSPNREVLQSTVYSDTRLIINKSGIDEFDLKKKGTDVNSFDNKNKIKGNEISSQKIKDLKEPVKDLLDSSEQIEMTIELRIHFTSDDIDINLYDNESNSFNYEMIEESNENMEEESYIKEASEKQGIDDFISDQTRSQFMNEHQISREISPSNNLNNSDLYYVEKTSCNPIDDQFEQKSISKYKFENNENKREDNYATFQENQINMNIDTLYKELDSHINIENGDNFESENDDINAKNKSTYSFFRIPLNCLRGLNRIFSVRSSNQTHISDMDYEQSSTDTDNYLTRYLHSPWCVLLLFVTGTLASPYWVEITRNISQSAVGADLIIDKISSTILHEDSVNRKYAILPLENH